MLLFIMYSKNNERFFDVIFGDPDPFPVLGGFRKFEFFWIISILSTCLESNILYCVLECKLWDEKFHRNLQTQEISIFVLILGLLAVLIVRYKSAVAMTSCMTNFRLFRWFKRNCIRFWLIFLACHSFFTPFDKSWR